jgi:hypothetical protein
MLGQQRHTAHLCVLGPANSKVTGISLSATASSVVIRSETIGNAFAPFYMVTDGSMRWGSGSGAIDTTLYRSAADTLKTDDSFVVGAGLSVVGDITSTTGNLILGSGGAAELQMIPSTSTTVANTTTETTLATFTIPANDAIAGAVYKITAWGTASTTGTPTMTFQARLGGVAGSAIAQSGAVTTASAASAKPWRAEVFLSCLTTGVSATWFGNMTCQCGFTLGAGVFLNPSTTIDGGAQFTLDSTVARDLVITGKWSAASASNTITCRGFSAMRVA